MTRTVAPGPGSCCSCNLLRNFQRNTFQKSESADSPLKQFGIDGMALTLEDLAQSIRTLSDSVAAGFADVSRSIGALGTRVDALDARVAGLDARIAGLDARVDRLIWSTSRLEAISVRVLLRTFARGSEAGLGSAGKFIPRRE